MLFRLTRRAALSLLAALAAGPLFAADPAPPSPATPASPAALREQLVGRAIEFLKTKGQSPDGSFNPKLGPSITALVVTGLIENGVSPNDPLVAKALKNLEGFVQETGGVHSPESTNQNYETCISLLAFNAANKDGRYDATIKKAVDFVKGYQWDEGEQADASSVNFGGAGYGKKRRPDLSNTSFLLEALKASGVGPEDPAVQRALVFVSRCQNLESAANTTPFAAKVNDGGFYYTPANNGESMAGQTENGGLRSYASMTYAGLKSMIYAGVGPDDPRVKAAFDWATKHYDLSSNPGMEQAGLYYYYHTFAKALDAMGVEEVTDSNGVKHAWKTELLNELAKRQQPDGSWVNAQPRWMEGDPVLVTGYALLTLSHLGPAPAEAKK